MGSYTIVNSGAPITSWTLKFSLPSSETITSAWSGNLASSGSTYTLTNADLERIPPDRGKCHGRVPGNL